MDSIVPISKPYGVVDNERIGMALAHMSAQANHLAQVHAVFSDQQAEQEARQKQFVEERVALARVEAEERTQELIRAISAAYGDPTAIERRVDDRIQNVLMTLQDSSLNQAREMAEAQLAEQNAAKLAMEKRIEAALLNVQDSAARRAEQSVQALVNKLSTDQQQLMVFQQAAASDRHELQVNLERLEEKTIQSVDIMEEKARTVVVSELDARMGQALVKLEDHVVRRAETHVVGLVKSLLEENRRQMQRQQQELQSVIEERVEQRLKEVFVVAKKAAEAQAREVIAESDAAVVQASSADKSKLIDGTMAGSTVRKMNKESISLNAARLQAQQEVIERADQRAKELIAAAALKVPIKRRQRAKEY